MFTVCVHSHKQQNFHIFIVAFRSRLYSLPFCLLIFIFVADVVELWQTMHTHMMRVTFFMCVLVGFSFECHHFKNEDTVKRLHISCSINSSSSFSPFYCCLWEFFVLFIKRKKKINNNKQTFFRIVNKHKNNSK